MILKPFKTEACSYLYSAWNNEIARVPQHVYELFTEVPDTLSTPERLRSLAVEVGLMPSQDITLSVFNESRIQDSLTELQKSGPSVLVLTITEKCNFRCAYCTYSGAYEHSRRHSNKSMSLETARRAVDWYLSFKRDDYHIGFYGGEPLLDFRLITDLVRYARQRCSDPTRLSLGLTTNGSLLDDRVGDFLADHGFEAHVSIDGPAEIHDRYRIDVRGKKTFNKVWKNICNLRNRHPEYFAESVGFTMTIVPPDPLAAMESFIQENKETFGGRIPKLGRLSEEDPGVFEHLALGPEQRQLDFSPYSRQFIEAGLAGVIPGGFSRACLEATMRRIHYREMFEIQDFETHAGQCVPGVRCHVDPDGGLHMCEHMSHHFPIGTLAGGFDTHAIGGYLREYGALVEENCRDCWALRLCKKCIANLARGRALSKERMAEFCVTYRKRLENSLIQYCSAREKNDHCFDWLPEEIPSREEDRSEAA